MSDHENLPNQQSPDTHPVGESSLPRELSYADISKLDDLERGDIITGIHSGRELDDFDRRIGKAISDPVSSFIWVPKRPLSAEMRPPKFRGELKDVAAVVEDSSPWSARFTIMAVLFSTGRGEQGLVAREVAYTPGPDLSYNPVTRKLGPRTEDLQDDQIGIRLLLDSSEASRAAKEAALRHMFPGGLPGLGKR